MSVASVCSIPHIQESEQLAPRSTCQGNPTGLAGRWTGGRSGSSYPPTSLMPSQITHLSFPYSVFTSQTAPFTQQGEKLVLINWALAYFSSFTLKKKKRKKGTREKPVHLKIQRLGLWSIIIKFYCIASLQKNTKTKMYANLQLNAVHIGSVEDKFSLL